MIVNEINKEIKDIFIYIKNYIYKYKEKNIYNIHYNLFKINELFFKNSFKFLLDELKKIIKETIPIHLATMNYNYKFGFWFFQWFKTYNIGYS